MTRQNSKSGSVSSGTTAGHREPHWRHSLHWRHGEPVLSQTVWGPHTHTHTHVYHIDRWTLVCGETAAPLHHRTRETTDAVAGCMPTGNVGLHGRNRLLAISVCTRFHLTIIIATLCCLCCSAIGAHGRDGLSLHFIVASLQGIMVTENNNEIRALRGSSKDATTTTTTTTTTTLPLPTSHTQTYTNTSVEQVEGMCLRTTTTYTNTSVE